MTKHKISKIKALEMRVVELERLLSGRITPQPPIITVKRMSTVSSPYSLQGQVVNATIELIRKYNRPIKTPEILQRLKELHIPLGKNNKALMAAILGNEVKKQGTARLVRVARGLYDLPENQKVNL